ncbi:MAG: MFS transporter [Rhodospirillaceae bacterium]|nr:MFS transporter [Rhodospirillaceae bacterium]
MEPAGRGQSPSAGALWQRTDFRHLIAALGISHLGAKIAREALPLTAVLVLGAGPLAMSGITVASALPTILMALHAGAFLDRVRRRPAMIWSDLIRCLVLLSVPLAAFLGVMSVAQLCVVAFCVSAGTLAFDIADQAYLPGLVGRDQVLTANAAKEATDAGSEIVGPPLGGLLVQVIGGPLTILINAFSYLLSAFFLWRIRADEETAVSLHQPDIRREIRQGITVLWRDSVLRPLLFARFIRTFFGGMLGPFYVLYLVRDLGIAPLMLGLIVAVGGGASLIGSAVAPRLAAALPVGPGLILAFAVKTLGLACVPVAGLMLGVSPWLVIGLLMMQQLLADGSTGYFAVLERTLRQRRVPAELLGRAGATTRLVNDAPVPFAAILGGFLAESHGIDFVLWLAIGGYALSPVVAFFSDVRKVTRV